MIKRNNKGITLLVLVVTIIILLILAGVTIALLTGENGILNKTKIASNETDKQISTEIMNLKITNIQIETYTEKQQMPTLQEFANSLCDDEEIEYVITKGTPLASILPLIDTTGYSSIFTKLKNYPYEFEIDGNLKLSSINGDKVDTENTNTDNNNSDKINSKIEEIEIALKAIQLESDKLTEKTLQLETMVTTLQSNSSKKSKLIEMPWKTTTNSIPASTWTDIETISLSGNGTGKAIISYSASSQEEKPNWFDIDVWRQGGKMLGTDGEHSGNLSSWKRGSVSAIISYDENTSIKIRAISPNSIKVGYTYSILLLPD